MLRRRLVVVPTVAWVWVALSTAPFAAPLAEVPDKLQVPAGQVLAFDLPARGVQIYVCSARKDDATKFEWTLKAPEAELFDASGKKVVKHYGGPTWEADDGSKVVGELKARDDGPDPNAIPWLLLSAKMTSGNGMLAKTVSIQRLRTVGGKAPGDGCSEAAQAGHEVRIPYQAHYAFYTQKP